MMKTTFRLTIFKTNTRGQEKIIDIKDFPNRVEMQNYLEDTHLEPKQYPLPKEHKRYLLSAECLR